MTEDCNYDDEKDEGYGYIKIEKGKVIFENVRGIEYGEAKGITGTPKKIVKLRKGSGEITLFLVVLTEEGELFYASHAAQGIEMLEEGDKGYIEGRNCNYKRDADKNELMTFEKIDIDYKILDVVSRSEIIIQPAPYDETFVYIENMGLRLLNYYHEEEVSLGKRWGELFPYIDIFSYSEGEFVVKIYENNALVLESNIMEDGYEIIETKTVQINLGSKKPVAMFFEKDEYRNNTPLRLFIITDDNVIYSINIRGKNIDYSKPITPDFYKKIDTYEFDWNDGDRQIILESKNKKEIMKLDGNSFRYIFGELSEEANYKVSGE